VNPLGELLARRIRTHGPLTIGEFMAEALGHPEYGYYATRDPFGRRGDFTTAPEISQIFGELIGLWCADLWERMGRPAPFILAELGPGRGTLMADALRAARIMPGFLAAMRLKTVLACGRDAGAGIGAPALRRVSAARATPPPSPSLRPLSGFTGPLPRAHGTFAQDLSAGGSAGRVVTGPGLRCIRRRW
jgi:hypothetical protein